MRKSPEIILTGGYGGKSKSNPNGFRISKGDRDRLLELKLKTRLNQGGIIIEFPSGESSRLSLEVTPSFWEDWSPIFTHTEIRAWMKKRGDAPWPERKPPKYIAKLSRAGTKVDPIKIKILRRINEVEPVKMPAPEQSPVTEQEITLTGDYWGAKYSRHNPNGFRISPEVARDLFIPLKSRLDQKGVIIEFPSGESPRLSLEVTPSFWDHCHEFRIPEIGAWMKKRGDAPWPEGEPSKYTAKLSTDGAGAIKIKILGKLEQSLATEQEITLTGGYGGASKHNPNGFRILQGDRDRLFKGLKTRINREGFIIEFPSGEAPRLSLKVTPSFWRKERSPILTHTTIRAWIEQRGDAPWPEGKPPKYSAKLSTAGTGPIKIKVPPEDKEGIESEQEEEQSSHPFKPEKIRIRTVSPTIDQIVLRLAHNEIILTPGFQRRLDIWEPVDRSRLIESLLLRIPIPVFYVATDENEVWSVVDGLQRISTIRDYIKNEFPLEHLEYLTGQNGNCYKDLSRPMQRRISETQLIVNVIEPETPQEVMFNIFQRINTGGLKLNGQEIRHALNPGPVLNYLEELARTKEFLMATDESISPKRMADQECILRFLAFHIDPWEGYYSIRSLDRHLGEAMRKINNMDESERDRLSADFKKTMCAAYNILGKYAFRKRYSQRDKLRPINRALFESWSVGLARRSDEEIEFLVNNRKKIVRDFISCMNDNYDFEAAISASTGDPVKVRKRFQVVDDIINKGISHAS